MNVPATAPPVDAAARLGFACPWEADPVATWSGTAWNLLQALRRRTTVVDLGVHPSPLTRVAFKAAYTRRRQGAWVTTWKHTRAWQNRVAREIRRSAERSPCDAVIQIGDLAALDQPFLPYQDLCYDALLEAYDDESGVHHFPGLDRDDLLRCRDRQYEIYDRAAGILVMSQWLAQKLVDSCGVPRHRVHVVHPGMATRPVGERPTVERERRRRLLFVGRDLMTKGGDVVVAAVARLRVEFDPGLTLTVIGPRTWPLDGAIPPGIIHLGSVPSDHMQSVYDDHDLLVMPSRLEGFGMVFAEALAAGVPCVGRRAYAMPELIRPGHNGALVGSDDVDELARAIVEVLDDDEVYATCAAERRAVAEHFTWDRAAADTLAAVDAALAGRPGSSPGPETVADTAKGGPIPGTPGTPENREPRDEHHRSTRGTNGGPPLTGSLLAAPRTVDDRSTS